MRWGGLRGVGVEMRENAIEAWVRGVSIGMGRGVEGEMGEE